MAGMHDASRLHQQQHAQQKLQPPKAQPQTTSDIFSMLLNDS